jgi:uncharacterized repeat protein (TIGR02543 family)
MPVQQFEADVSQALLPNAFALYGYWFDGWNTKADGSGVKYNDMQRIYAGNNFALYAQWEPR